jgi:hypothetical protein
VGRTIQARLCSNFEIRYEEQLEITIPNENLPSISWRMATLLERWLMWRKWGVLVKQGTHMDTRGKCLYTEKAKNETN